MLGLGDVGFFLRGSFVGPRRIPTQNWIAGSTDFVESADARGMWSGFYEVSVGRGLVSDRFHRVDEEVALFL